MGYLHGGVCHETVDEFYRSYVSATPPVSVYVDGLGLVTHATEHEPGGAVTWVRYVNGNVDDFFEFYPSAPSCAVGDAVLDGMALGWMVGAVFVAAFAFVLLRRALR